MLDAANWTTRLGELARQARVPGAVLGIWTGGQEIVAACGVLNRATRVRVSTDSVFQVGSITKLWTATMIMQLIDAGLLSLDTTVAQALPGLRLGRLGVPAGRGVLLLQQRLGPARPDDRGTRRPVVGRLAGRTAVHTARAGPDRHPARGGDLAPGGGRAPARGRPGPGLGAAPHRAPGRADPRGAARPARLRPVPPRRRADARRQATAQRGFGDGHAAAP